MITRKLLLLTLCLAVLFGINAVSYAAYVEDGEEHLIAIGSDRHGNTAAIAESMGTMPKAVEYVNIAGDIVGSGKDRTPDFETKTVLDEVLALGFDNVKSKDDVNILWADHDSNGTDTSGIMFGDKGEGSGLMHTGYNRDGSVSYYVYGIAFYDMQKENAKAAAAFESWVDSVQDRRIPIIVICHMPMHYARKDNKGGDLWNKALNYAATGAETTEDGADIIRNVIYFHGHNHTDESGKGYTGEFYVPCGARMEVGAEAESWSTIYYSYTTAGYLNTNKAASLITIGKDKITVSKYTEGQITDGFYDTESKESGAFASSFSTSGVNTIKRVAAPKRYVLAKAVSSSKTSIKVSWAAAQDANKYIIYYAKPGKSTFSRFKTVKSGKAGSVTIKGLKKNRNYRFKVAAYHGNNRLSVSAAAESLTCNLSSNGKWTNTSSVAVRNTRLSVKKDKTVKINGAALKGCKKGKKILGSNKTKFRYVSSDTTIATVTSKGTVKGIRKGSCKVYVIAPNGVRKAVSISVA